MTDKTPGKHVHPSDLRALAQLTTQGAVALTRIVEGVHQSVWTTLGVAGGEQPGQTGGLTGLVYKSIQGVTRLLGAGAESLLTRLHPLLESAAGDPVATPQREAVLAALNGVMGDRLAAHNNPLAMAMDLRYQGRTLDWQATPPMPEATGKVLVLIHGLCMSGLYWQEKRGPRGSAAGLAGAMATGLGYTPVYLRYNSGLHISQNGRQLAALLQQLADNWPLALEDLSVLAHSMGGLLIRSAVHYARQQGLTWPDRLKAIVFLGTPHHGAPLERAGNRVDVLLGSTPYTAPFAKLGHLRSAGITDLRYGYVLDTDWHGHDRFLHRADAHQHLPLPEGIACFAVAASTAAKHSPLAERLIGDGLVPLASALGQHPDARRSLSFHKTSQFIAYRTNHLGLLSSEAVRRQVLRWLRPAASQPGAPPASDH